MTALDPYPLDPHPHGPHAHDRQPYVVDETDAHLLRLCLDLQLDALLLTLGAASAQRLRDLGGPPGAGRTADDVPWRRWVDEDVDLAASLAADAMAGRATLPPTLGTDLGHEVPAAVIDSLVARYESMCDLLVDLLGEDGTPDGGTRDDDHRHPRVRAALTRCRARLDEMHRYRLGATPPHGVRVDREYLPGELLG